MESPLETYMRKLRNEVIENMPGQVMRPVTRKLYCKEGQCTMPGHQVDCRRCPVFKEAGRKK
jgi:hypothetical protein